VILSYAACICAYVFSAPFKRGFTSRHADFVRRLNWHRVPEAAASGITTHVSSLKPHFALRNTLKLATILQFKSNG
jgi:hypothetical protein